MLTSSTSNVIAMLADVELIEAAEGETPVAGPKKFAVKAYNGGALSLQMWDSPVVVDLAGMKAAKSVVANLYHNSQRLVGHATEIANDGSKLAINGVISATGPDAIEFANNAANGFPWQASIEAQPMSEPEYVGKGEKVTVNGQTFTGPLQVVRKSKLYGIAFVPRGADENTNVKIAATAANNTNKGTVMEPALKTFIEASGFDAETLNEAQLSGLKKAWQTEVAAKIAADGKLVLASGAGNDGAALMGDDHFDLASVLAAHADLVGEMEEKIAQHEDDITDLKAVRSIKAEARDAAKLIKQSAIAEKWTMDRFELEAVKASAKVELNLVRAERPVGPAISASKKDGITQDVLSCAVAMSGKLPESQILAAYGEKTMQAVHTNFKSAMGLQELILAAAMANGYSGFSYKSDPQSCFNFACRPIHAGGFSNVDISGILSNNANKFLLRGYTFVESTWREIAGVRPVNDFKTVTSYRMTGLDSFEQLAPDGKIRHGDIGEESYTNKADTYALMLSVTRKDIINDDLGAITSVPQAMGRSAGTKLNEIFWAEFLDNSTFFTAARANYFEGATTNLGIDSLTTAERMFLDMVDSLGKPISAMPAILLTPTNISTLARTLYTAQEIRDTTASTKFATANPHINRFRPVVSRYLSNSALGGNSGTAWYLIADPMEAATIEVAFLNGVEVPTIEQSATEFDTLGIAMRGYFDFGVAKQDYRVGVKSKGSA